ncbi:MAG: hybrid sensor histidine kinase/response regulator [Candidatus Abyssobacteria bacterium SURF_5]|uniref:histidine kinase n=1 Tax=Abyssobacteria bacterium (strain SURF_5) TaxID=2093360 RepID=A0A3A4ND75_ABYX5|nr:MAG: hybrid sensor histidine kinase/response regulator [Candidatus Abyssubacteria bacterium SURF_5]
MLSMAQTNSATAARILIVEDDPRNIDLLKAQLSEQGYLIEAAVDGEDALQRVTLKKPDLILLDIMLPKKSGFEVCKVIKTGADTRSIPVIMVTALKDMESRIKGITVGADDFLTRPVDKSELVSRVKSMLRIKRLHDELLRESEHAHMASEQLQLQQRVMKSMSTQLMQASHLKYEFIVNMSHALRTPLNVIIGFSEMMQDELVGALNERQSKYVNNVLESGRELQKLITNIVDVFKIDTGKVPLEMTEFSLDDLIQSAVKQFEQAVREKNVRVSVEVAPSVARIYADPQKLLTILHNLLSNALKVTPPGGRVAITARRDGPTALICVEDTGIGLSPEECLKVFQEFYKTPDSAAAGGSGLGLAIAKKLVLLQNGDIWAESNKGKGTRFFFTLPCDRIETRS